jgi:hypothetical protein
LASLTTIIEHDLVRGFTEMATPGLPSRHLRITIDDDRLVIARPDGDKPPAAGRHYPGVSANGNDGSRNRGIDCVSTLFGNLSTGFSGYPAAGGNRDLTHRLNAACVAKIISGVFTAPSMAAPVACHVDLAQFQGESGC